MALVLRSSENRNFSECIHLNKTSEVYRLQAEKKDHMGPKKFLWQLSNLVTDLFWKSAKFSDSVFGQSHSSRIEKVTNCF